MEINYLKIGFVENHILKLNVFTSSYIKGKTNVYLVKISCGVYIWI